MNEQHWFYWQRICQLVWKTWVDVFELQGRLLKFKYFYNEITLLTFGSRLVKQNWRFKKRWHDIYLHLYFVAEKRKANAKFLVNLQTEMKTESRWKSFQDSSFEDQPSIGLTLQWVNPYQRSPQGWIDEIDNTRSVIGDVIMLFRLLKNEALFLFHQFILAVTFDGGSPIVKSVLCLADPQKRNINY